jgi:hypothetical protein
MRWTDKLVKEFARVYTAGKYLDGYRDCYTIDLKLKRFEQIKDGKYEA